MLQRKAIIFYDGTCGFCQGSIQFILKHNKRQNFYFVTLQSGIAQELVPHAQLPDPLPDSILYYENGGLYIQSEAVLRIARHLNFPFSLLYNFRFIPLTFRNFVYQFIARNRYRIAGKADACMLPDPEIRARFL